MLNQRPVAALCFVNDMIRHFKNLFRKSYGTKETYQDIVQNDVALKSVEKQTFDIFKATKLHPELTEAEQRSFFIQCKALTKDEVLDRVIDEIVGEYAESIIQTAITMDGLLQLRYKMLGADEVRKRLIGYSQQIEEHEDFDKHSII